MLYKINGKPIPWQRPARGNYQIYDSQKHTKLAYGISLQSQSDCLDTYPLEGPLHLNATFKFPMAKASNHDKLRGTYHYYKPDSSNLVKLIEDVMTDIQFYHDDCQISVITAKKVWDDEGSTEFEIIKL